MVAAVLFAVESSSQNCIQKTPLTLEMTNLDLEQTLLNQAMVTLVAIFFRKAKKKVEVAKVHPRSDF
jgi:hypothetical protein